VLGVFQKLIFFKFKIKDRKDENRPAGEYQIETLIQWVIIDGGSREERIITSTKDRCHKNYVFEEHEADQKAVPSVSLSTMDKEKLLKELKLADCIITRTGCLLPLQT
jgi:hypothetical protein